MSNLERALLPIGKTARERILSLSEDDIIEISQIISKNNRGNWRLAIIQSICLAKELLKEPSEELGDIRDPGLPE